MKRAILAMAMATGVAAANVDDFTETFETNAGWIDGGFTPLTEVASGSSDGTSYVTTNRSFLNTDPGSFDVLFRGEPSVLPGIIPDASGGAFQGDYISSGITQLSFDVRHNGVAPVNFFVRIAPPTRFPGAIAVEFVPVFGGSWTTVTIDISSSSFNFVSFEGFTYDDIFDDVGLIQIGIDSTNLAGIPGDFTFDLDNVSITPTPGVTGVLAIGGLVAARRRRG
ncbi:MAG: hypothetical protein AAGI53_15295 [Planctomycetota bacterium]